MQLSRYGLLSTLRFCAMAVRNKSDTGAFREKLAAAKHLVVLTGAGISAESGIPTFRGSGGLWRTYEATSLATPEAFKKDPSLVWEFYHYRRELVFQKKPNEGHFTLARLEQKMRKEGKEMVVITQNIDGFHSAAGSQNILELHGNLFKTRCTKCEDEVMNRDSPICPALKDKGSPDAKATTSDVPVADLPRCKKCQGLVRPAVVWFGENLDSEVLEKAERHLDACDLCLIVGTSSVVYPAAGFGMHVAVRGVPVAEFNIDSTMASGFVDFHFEGPSGEMLPRILQV